MRRVIHKFRVPLSHEVGHPDFPPAMTPIGCKRRLVGHDGRGRLCVWIELDPDDERVFEQHFVGYATGAEIPLGLDYVGSTISQGAQFVWHVFEKIRLNPHASGDY